MKKDRISIAFVGVYDQIIPIIPQLNADFCKNIFGTPENTLIGVSQEGLVISTQNKPFPLVVIGQQRLVIKASKEDILKQYMRTIDEELSKYNLPIRFSAYGINYEYQFLDINMQAEDWMWRSFIGNNVLTTAKYQSCSKISFRFGINDAESLNISIEPRVGVRDGLFIDVNHHHDEKMNSLIDENFNPSYISSSHIVEQYLTELKLDKNEQ